MSAQNLFTCANLKCKKVEKRFNEFSVCSLCKQAHYCSRGCQKKHWNAHKRECKKTPASPAIKKEKIDEAKKVVEEESKVTGEKKKSENIEDDGEEEPKITIEEHKQEDEKIVDKNSGESRHEASDENAEEEEEEDGGETAVEIDNESIEKDVSTELFPSDLPKPEDDLSNKIETEYSFIDGIESGEDDAEEEEGEYDSESDDEEIEELLEENEKDLMKKIEETKDIGKLLSQKDRTLKALGIRIGNLREKIKGEEELGSNLKRNIATVSNNFHKLEESFSETALNMSNAEIPKLLTAQYSSSICQSFTLMDRYMKHQVRRREIEDNFHMIEGKRMEKVKSVVDKQRKFRNEYVVKVQEDEADLKELKWKQEEMKRSFFIRIALVVLLCVLILLWSDSD